MEDSLYPPATDDAAATSTEPLYPSWVLLQEEVQYVGRENATTAEAQTFIGRAVRVTFLLADPPAVSYFGVHGPELELKDLLLGPRAVFSAKDLVLFRFVFTVRPRSTVAPAHNPAQYFVYKAAGRHGKPSLTPVPTSDRPQNFPSHPSVLPFEDEDGNFLVADLATAGLGRYNLHILSSKTNKWTTRTLQLQAPPAVISADLPVQTDKVIALGAGTIGWIDLWRGIVVCDVFDADPVLRFIPLPKPHFNLRLKGDPRSIRDVTCCSNGFIKFVEMETYPRPVSKGNFKTTKDLDTAHVLYDSELFYRSGEDLEEQPGPRTFRTCYRHTSWNLWCKGHNVHVGDILVKTPGYYTMLPQLWDDTAGKFTLRNLIAFCPVFGSSTHGGDVVYLASKLGNCDRKGWVLGVDLRKKTVEVLEPYSERYTVHQPSFLACTFSGYLNKTPSSCAPENGCGQNCPLSPGNIVQNNLNMEIVHPVNSFQFQPQLIVPPHSFPQTPQYKFIPSGPAVPFNTLMPPVPAYPAIPFNTLMPRVPMNEGFLSQVSPMPLSPAVPFDTMMPLVLTDDRFLSQMPPVHTVHHSSP